MSDDELNKLATEMQNIKPSKASRERGINAAKAAFDAEFAQVQSERAADGANEEISQNIQGSADEPRLTSQSSPISGARSPRSGMMSKFKNVFSYNPRSAMLMGSCTAALIAALVILPNSMQFQAEPVEEFAAISSEMGKEEIIVTARRADRNEVDADGAQRPVAADTRQPVAPAPIESEPTPPTLSAPVPSVEQYAGGTRSVDELLSKVKKDAVSQATENAQREAEFRGRILADKPAQLAVITPPKNGYAQIEAPSRDRFEAYESNSITAVKAEPVSTFSIDVDTASYSFLRSSINRGQLPSPSAIRLEEMINYFPYDYEAPRSADEPFKANVTVTPTPWNADTKLMHVGIKGYVPPADERPSSNIVFLIDTSGSMNQANKLPLLINSFKLLLGTLDEDDTVSIVTYAGSAGTVLEPTPASDKGKINEALTRLRAGGSTAGAAGLELAYQKAQESFDDEGVNRVILATDGDFNVGFSSPDDMKKFIEEKRETGIFLSVLGFGNGNYNDHLMQSLAQNGNGVAAYIDSLAEANKVLADEGGSALITIAKDVKIQVEFNPQTISEYRLIGYETRALNREDFNNDKVDAGEIGAGHSVTAIYELTPVGSPAQRIDDLRYVSGTKDEITTGSDEFAFVKIRHKLPNANKSTLQTFPVGKKNERRMRRANDDMRFATAVAAFGQKLRGDSYLEDFSYSDAIKLAKSAKGDDEHGYRAEFIELVRRAQSLEK